MFRRHKQAREITAKLDREFIAIQATERPNFSLTMSITSTRKKMASEALTCDRESHLTRKSKASNDRFVTSSLALSSKDVPNGMC